MPSSKPVAILKTRKSLRALHFHPYGAPLLLTAEVVERKGSLESLVAATSGARADRSDRIGCQSVTRSGEPCGCSIGRAGNGRSFPPPLVIGSIPSVPNFHTFLTFPIVTLFLAAGAPPAAGPTAEQLPVDAQGDRRVGEDGVEAALEQLANTLGSASAATMLADTHRQGQGQPQQLQQGLPQQPPQLQQQQQGGAGGVWSEAPLGGWEQRARHLQVSRLLPCVLIVRCVAQPLLSPPSVMCSDVHTPPL